MDNVFSLPKPCPLVVRVATNQIREDVNEGLEYGEWHGPCIWKITSSRFQTSLYIEQCFVISCQKSFVWKYQRSHQKPYLEERQTKRQIFVEQILHRKQTIKQLELHAKHGMISDGKEGWAVSALQMAPVMKDCLFYRLLYFLQSKIQ
jgi:hypothetical protein